MERKENPAYLATLTGHLPAITKDLNISSTVASDACRSLTPWSMGAVILPCPEGQMPPQAPSSWLLQAVEEFLAGKLRLPQNRHGGALRKLWVVRYGDQDSFPFVSEMDVVPTLADSNEPELRERLDHFPRGQDGKLCHNSDLDLNDSGPPLPGGELEQHLVVLPEPFGQVPHGLCAGLPLVSDVRDQVRRDVPLAFLLDLNDSLHDGKWMGLGL